MTLPPEKVGDKGQRFVARICGYPKPGWNDVGYADTQEAAYELCLALMKAPSAQDFEVIDRERVFPGGPKIIMTSTPR